MFNLKFFKKKSNLFLTTTKLSSRMKRDLISKLNLLINNKDKELLCLLNKSQDCLSLSVTATYSEIGECVEFVEQELKELVLLKGKVLYDELKSSDLLVLNKLLEDKKNNLDFTC